MRPTVAVLLAAGIGSRLAPLTDVLPKCLMPIGGRPLLDYWLTALSSAGISHAVVNLHAHSDLVHSYLSRPVYAHWVYALHERNLLGTAGTLRELAPVLPEAPVVVAHADNLISCDFRAFIDAHSDRTKGTAITMMTFSSSTPTSCGIVNVNDDGVVTHMEEKPVDPKGCLANGAVYILEPQVIRFIVENPDVGDISTGVLPHFMGKIQSWYNPNVLRDIGTLDQLRRAQRDQIRPIQAPKDAWQIWYRRSREFGEIQRHLGK